MLGEYIASAPLTLLVKPGGGIRPIAVGTIWRRLVSKVSATMIGHSLDGYLVGLQFGVGVPGGGEAILHAVNHLVEDRGDDVGLSMLLVDFQNAFNLVEFCYSSLARLYYGEHSLWSCQGVQQGDPLLLSLVLHPLICKIRDSFNLCLQAWYLDDGTIVGDTLVVGKVLELITEDGPRCGLHLNVDKTELFWTKEDPRSRLEGIFPPNISRPLHGVKLLGGPVSVDVDFGSALVMKRVSSTIGLLDAVAKINDPQCELLLIRACAGVSKLYFAMRTCSPRVFESAQLSFDMALRSALERIVTASGPGFGDWQWRLATLPFAFGGLGVYSAGDVLNYAFIASRLQSAALQTKLLRHVGIVTSGSTFDDALCVFNNAMEIDFLSTPSEVAAPKIMKKMADIYFTRVTKDAESSFSLSPRQMALWQSQREEHTSDWLRVVPISGLGQTMNGKTYRCVLCYRLGVPLFSVSKPCSACSKVFTGDVYGDHAVSCAGVIGIKHRHNTVRDTLIDICSRSGISAGKEVDIDADEEVTLIDETQERNDEEMLFDVQDDLRGEEVVAEKEVAEKEVSVADPITTAGEVVTTANIDELTLAQTLIEIKTPKPKAITTAATTTTTTRPKARGVVVQEPSEFKTTSSPSQASQLPQAKDKGKAIMVEPKKYLKKKDQIALDEEVARNLEAQLQAELEEERLARQKKEEATIALIES
ncbi:hypothetical protein Tco_1270544 [Tanacetum coccineum]